MRRRPIALAAAGALLAFAPRFALAASSPFGVAIPDSPIGSGVSGPFAPILLYAIRLQTEFYHGLTSALSAFASDPHAGLWLMGLSFLYGIFHAVGPGHGKAVIASYLVATGDSARRGVLLSLTASIVQALTAIAVVSVAAIVFDVTAATMTGIAADIGISSYGLITVLGSVLVVSKGRNALDAWKWRPAGAGAYFCDEIPRGVVSEEELACVGGKAGATTVRHGVDCACAEVSRLAVSEPTAGWPRLLATVGSVGLRPCSGALIVLVFALSLGRYAAGVASVFAMAGGTAVTVGLVALFAATARDMLSGMVSSDGVAMVRISAVIQLLAAFAVLAFGLVMTAGAIAAEGLL